MTEPVEPKQTTPDPSETDYDDLANRLTKLMFFMRRPPHPPRAIPPKRPPLEKLPSDLRDVHRGAMGVLGILASVKDGISPSLIGSYANLSKGRVSNIITALEERGYVVKRPSPSDSRSITVELTKKGRTFIVDHERQVHAHIVCILEQLGPHDAEEGIRILERLADILEQDENSDACGRTGAPCAKSGAPCAGPDDSSARPHDSHAKPGTPCAGPGDSHGKANASFIDKDGDER